MCTYWFPHCQPSSKFPLWWTLSGSTFGTSTILGSILPCIGQHGETCTSALHSISCYHMERLCFTHFDFCGCWHAEDAAYFSVVLAERWEQAMHVWKQTASSQRQFVFPVQKKGRGGYGHRLMYLLSVLRRVSWRKQVWISLICHQRRCTLLWKSLWTQQHFNTYILVMSPAFRIKC